MFCDTYHGILTSRSSPEKYSLIALNTSTKSPEKASGGEVFKIALFDPDPE